MQAPLPVLQENSAAPAPRDEPARSGALFVTFCFWTLVLLCRPQDIFPSLEPLRPALLTGIITLFMVLVRSGDLSRTPLFSQQQLRLYAALLLVMIMGIPFSLYARLSFNMIFGGYVNVVLFVIIFFKVVKSIDRLSTVILVGCLGNGLYSLYTVASGELAFGRLYFAEMFDPNDLAFFALSFLPLNLLFVSRGNHLAIRIAAACSFGAGTLLILLSGSRGGFVAFGVAAFLLLFMKNRIVRPFMKIIFVALCLVFVSLAPLNTERYMTIVEIEEDYNLKDETGRINLWKIGMDAMIHNPLTGVGVGNFPMAVGLDRQRRGIEERSWQAAHNMVVQIGSETGVIGMALFLLMSVNVMRTLRRVKKGPCPEKLARIAEMGLVGFAGLFVSGMFLSQAYSFYWAFYVVFSAVVSCLAARRRQTDGAPA